MKNFNVTFKNNKLIDQNTGKEIHLKPNGIFSIQGDEANFLSKNVSQDDYKPLDQAQKLLKLQKEYKNFKLERIANSESVLYFRIGLGKMREEDQVREFLFRAVLEEDLYIKSKSGDKWNLCECICKADKLVEGVLDFNFEPVYASSLSELFANVVSSYFNQKRATACNAFTTFYFESQNVPPSLNWIKQEAKLNLDVKRTEVMKQIKVKL